MKINWKEVLFTAAIGAVGALILLPLISPAVTPLLRKMPVIGSKY